MDTWFNASGGGGGQNITIDGSVLKDMKLTIKESWLNVGSMPSFGINVFGNDTIRASLSGSKPVELDGYLYHFIKNNRTQNVYKFIKFNLL